MPATRRLTDELREREQPVHDQVTPVPCRPSSTVLLVSLVVPAWILLLSGGVEVVLATHILAILVTQVATGALLWRLARGREASYVTELVGMGLALGTLTSLLGAQLLRPTSFGPVGWLLPTLALAAGLTVPQVRSRLRSGVTLRVTRDEAGSVAGGVGIGLIFLWSFWQAHPLSWDGWWSYYVDIPYHEALATSLATWGPNDSILAVGEPVRYHWFAHAWAGATTNASSAGSFVVITRVLPLVALVGTVCLAWAWSRRLSNSRSVPILAVLLTTLSMDVGSRLPVNFLQVFTLSPSMGIAALWLLGGALVLTEHLAGRLRRPYALLALLAVGCVGGKTSNAAVLVGGLGLAALTASWRPGLRARVWGDFGVVLAAVAGGFILLILGSVGSLSLEGGASARTYAFLASEGWVGVGVGTIAVALAIAAKWAGLAALVLNRATRHRPELWFAVGAAVTGLVLMATLGHPGASQLYFPLSATLVVAVVSAWGLGEALRHLSFRGVVIATLVGVSAGTAGLAARPPWFFGPPPYLTWLLPLLVLLGGLVLGSVRRPTLVRRRLLLTTASLTAVALVTASLTSGLSALGELVRAGRPAAPPPNATVAWTPAHTAALVWLRENAQVEDVVATNRQCSTPQIGGAVCRDARWYLTAALSQRRMYIEGASYADDSPLRPSWVGDRVDLSRRFVDQPTQADAAGLWDAGVRWVLVDLVSTTTRAWMPHARQAFTTETSVVLELLPPDRPGLGGQP